MQNCTVCGTGVTAPTGETAICYNCRNRYPPSLIKACGDPFFYALRLRTGEIVRFEEAEIHGDYCTVKGQGERLETESEPPIKHHFPRGLDIRIADIVWCADAPDGS